jgi:hypothetical protein
MNKFIKFVGWFLIFSGILIFILFRHFSVGTPLALTLESLIILIILFLLPGIIYLKLDKKNKLTFWSSIFIFISSLMVFISLILSFSAESDWPIAFAWLFVSIFLWPFAFFWIIAIILLIINFFKNRKS